MKLIVNPVAANGTVGKRWPRIRDFLRAEGAEFDAVLTERPGHATELARQALAEGHRIIVAVGGDGTVNEVVNGLMVEGAVDPEVALGIIPGGTGADLARTLGIPRDDEGACRCLLRSRRRLIDLGEIICIREGQEARRYFANVAGLGFDGEVADLVNRNPMTKALGGTIPYLICLFITLITYRNKNAEVSFDGQSLKGRATSVFVANGQYLAGGMHIAPHAAPDDGLFDVIVLGDFGKLELAANVAKVYRGTHLTIPKVDEYRGVKEVRVEAQERMLIQADGELVGQAPTTFRIVPQALWVVA